MGDYWLLASWDLLLLPVHLGCLSVADGYITLLNTTTGTSSIDKFYKEVDQPAVAPFPAGSMQKWPWAFRI